MALLHTYLIVGRSSYSSPSTKGLHGLPNIQQEISAIFFPQNKKCFFLKNGQPRPLFCLFLVFSTKHHYNFYNKYMWKKCPSSIRCRDLNPQPLERESLPITNRRPRNKKKCFRMQKLRRRSMLSVDKFVRRFDLTSIHHHHLACSSRNLYRKASLF